jgi:hypothetical protein
MKAECTWGEGPDVLVILDGTPMVLYEEPKKGTYVHGTCTQGSLELTAHQVEDLAKQLLRAAARAMELDRLSSQEKFHG